MNKKTLTIVAITAVVTIAFSDKIATLPLVNKIPRF